MTTDCESVGRPASFLRLLRHSLVFLLTVYATYSRFEFRHIQPPLEPNFNRLVCSRIYSLSILNLFIVCSFVQFYPIVVSAWTKITCAFFYCRINVPGGVWTRDNLIKSQVLLPTELLAHMAVHSSAEIMSFWPSGLIICFILDYCRDTSPRWVLSGPPWTRTRNAEATGLQPAAIPIPLTDPLPNISLYHH